MKTVDQIFVDLGGTSEAATALGLKLSAASEIRRRGKFPVWYWPKLLDVCREKAIRDVNYDVLVSHHAKSHEGKAA